MATPVVVQGPRGPESRGQFRKETGLPVEVDFLEGVHPAQQGEAVFVSPNPQYRVVLWEDWNNPSVDRKGNRKPDRREAQFRGGIYRTTDTREITALRTNGSHGVFYYERAKLESMAREAKLSSALAAADDPEVAAALRTKLGVQEMPLPPRDSAETAAETTQKQVVRPIK
jgi:hypothetical protein